MALTRHRHMRSNPVELLVVNPGRPGMTARHNPEWARRLGRGMYRGTRYAAESARDLYHGAREAHRAHRAAAGAASTTMNPGRKPKKKRNPAVALPQRDRHGKFTKRRLKNNPKKKAKKKAKAKAKKASPSRRRRRRPAAKRRVTVARIMVKANPAKRRRRRKARKSRVIRGKRATVVVRANPPRRRKRNPLSKRFRAKAKRAVAVIRRRRRSAPAKSLRRRALSAQLRRASAIASLASSRASAKRIRPAIRGLQKAMLTRNPSLEGMIVAAKALAIPAAVSTASLVGTAYLGKMVADMLTTKDGKTTDAYIKDGKLTAMAQYAPAVATAAVSGVAFMVANRVLPQYRGAILLGGLSAAILQAVMASDVPQVGPLPENTPFLDKAKQALALSPSPSPSAVVKGFGEYTTVGDGIFHGLGEYTTVGGGGDNRTEFAADSLRGLDDASHFAAGEGGVLSGGIFGD